MSYTLVSNNGTIVVLDETTDTTSTSLSLVGRRAIDWGDNYAQNFLNLLEHFAGSTAPVNPRHGQQWWDSANQVMKVYGSSNTWSLVASSSTTATKLAAARTIALSGAVTGSASFDGSANITISTTPQVLLTGTGTSASPNVPNIAYSSPRITIDAYGRVIAIENTGGDGAGPPSYVSFFNGRTGAITLTSADVTGALGYTPTNGGLTSINSGQVISALGYTPANDASVVHKSGDTMSGTLNMNGQRIIGLPAPSDGSEPARLADLNTVSTAASNKTQRIFQSTIDTQYSVTVSPNAPSGGNDGDVWYRY